MPSASTTTVDSSSRPSRGRSCQNEDKVGRGETAVDMSSMVARTTDSPQTVIRPCCAVRWLAECRADPTYSGGVDLAVGFDLDMTLVDSSDGIVATVRAAVAEVGYSSRPDDVWPPPSASRWRTCSRPTCRAELVLPVADRLPRALPGDRGAAARPRCPAPHEAFAAVRAAAAAGSSWSAPSPSPPSALVLDQVGLQADVVVGPAVRRRQGHRAARARGQRLRRRPPRRRRGRAGGRRRRPSRSPPARTTRRRWPRPARTSSCLGLEPFPAWLDAARPGRAAGRPRRAGWPATGSLVVAFSGGADSAFLLAAAVRALGPDATSSPRPRSAARWPTGELDRAARVRPQPRGAAPDARRPTSWPATGYRANAGDRCFFCKAELLDVLRPLAPIARARRRRHRHQRRRRPAPASGPGIRAAAERGALTPLRDAGLTKAQVRAAAARWGLPTWDKPAAACLSSRIAYGVQITRAGLARVDRAEAAARAGAARPASPSGDLRVRDLGRGPGPGRGRRRGAGRAGRRPAPAAELLAAVLAAGFESPPRLDPRASGPAR